MCNSIHLFEYFGQASRLTFWYTETGNMQVLPLVVLIVRHKTQFAVVFELGRTVIKALLICRGLYGSTACNRIPRLCFVVVLVLSKSTKGWMVSNLTLDARQSELS